MKIVIIGGVAAGTKTGAKLKREIPEAEVIIYTKGSDISYAGCGLPYYIGGSIEEREELIVNTPEKFTALTGVEVRVNSEVTKVNKDSKTIVLNNGETVAYDKLVIASGAESFIPPVEGTDLQGVFKVRTPDDAIDARKYVDDKGCKKAVVIGGGFIGLEVAENLMQKGLSVTVMDMASQLMPNIFDKEMADYVRRNLQKKGLRIMTGTEVKGINGTTSATGVQTSSGVVQADIVMMAVGIRPATSFLADTGIEMFKGTILTDEFHGTNVEDIYAVGDCACVTNRITGKRQWSAMGSTANIAGRELALNIAGEKTPYSGCLGTGVVRLSDDMNASRTGLTEEQAKEAGFNVCSVICVINDKAHYYPDASSFVVKLISDKESRRLLGAQIIGSGAVDKMADIAVAGISLKAKVDDFLDMDFAYAPPFSTAIHPFATACSILVNKMDGKFDSFTPVEYAENKAADYKVLDAHPVPSITGYEWFDLLNAKEMAAKYDKDEKLLLVCAKGKRGYLVQNVLRSYGFTNVKVLEGGDYFNVIKRTLPTGAKIPAAEIKRVKGLGCLQDKRFNNIFNVRVITKNGKITIDEHRVIAEAAERFGSGEITMTTRLTLEIQGVPYENIDPLLAFLGENGLETGGTGSLVRPVVSCKGTTCQYGLIDTFGLSEKIHERFYKGYHDVTLPHKFKIAVGGCPNNCVKPDLNDLGIIGQRMPLFDVSKCRGCKVCQVVENCPIKSASVVDGKLATDETCNSCGRCVEKCPFGVTKEYQNGYKIYIGGRWGKKIAHGHALDKLFTSEEEVLDTVERAILLFRNEGITGERFADTVNRLGFDYVQDKLLHAEIDKAAILKKKVKGGATC